MASPRKSVAMPEHQASPRSAEVVQLREALTTLYALLEEYAPVWYTDAHRDKADLAMRSREDVANRIHLTKTLRK